MKTVDYHAVVHGALTRLSKRITQAIGVWLDAALERAVGKGLLRRGSSGLVASAS